MRVYAAGVQCAWASTIKSLKPRWPWYSRQRRRGARGARERRGRGRAHGGVSGAAAASRGASVRGGDGAAGARQRLAGDCMNVRVVVLDYDGTVVFPESGRSSTLGPGPAPTTIEQLVEEPY